MRGPLRRACTLLSKLLQALANRAEFGEKENYMAALNPFVRQHIPSVDQFLDLLSLPQKFGEWYHQHGRKVSDSKQLQALMHKRSELFNMVQHMPQVSHQPD